MQTQFESRAGTIRADVVHAAAGYILREYGDEGYRVAPCFSTGRVAVFEVSHSDGSRFNIVADRWGNVGTVPEEMSKDEAVLTIVHRMDKAACAA